jgi:ankyrin repeat protein
MLAAGKGRVNVISYLIKSGADVNIQGKHKETALHLASGFGHKAAVELLLTNRAEFRATDTGLTPLMMASSRGYSEIAASLLAKEADVNAKQPDGWNALMHAAAKGDRATVSLLLAHKADVRAKNRDGNTAAKIAEEYRHQEIAELLNNSVKSKEDIEQLKIE